MFKARLPADKIRELGRAEIFADEYDESTHGRALHCPNPSCPVTLVFRQGGTVRGGFASRAAHFAKGQRQEHAPLCDYESDIDNPAKDRSIRAALADGRAILLNLNVPTGLTESFHTAANGAGPSPAFRVWQKAHRGYVPVTIRNVAEFLVQIDRIQRMGYMDALNRTFVNFREMRAVPFEDFCLGDDQERMIDLAFALRNDLRSGGSREAVYRSGRDIFGFPRLLEFEPDRKQNLHVKGARVPVPGDDGLFVNHSVYVHGRVVRDSVLEAKKLYILAVPYIGRDTCAGLEKREWGTAFTIDLKWSLCDNRQVMAAPANDPAPRPCPARHFNGPAQP